MTKRLRLTPENQLRRFDEDLERLDAGRPMDFSIGAHLRLLIRRVDALERAASAMSAGTAETNEDSAQGQRPASAVGEAETPNPLDTKDIPHV